jgi:hypothetical protein
MAVFVALALSTEAAAVGGDACATVAQNLKQTKAQLKEYLEAFQKLRNEKDARLLELLNHKINDLSERVRELDAEFAGCPNAKLDEGLTTVKSDEDQYATKSCPELSKMLLQLLRKTAALKRRERSLFSDLTATEKAELQQWNEELRIVKSVLKNRCSEPAKPSSQPKSKTPFKP